VERVANLERKIRNLEDALAAVRRAARAPTPSRPAPGSDAPGVAATGGDDGNALREAAQAYGSHDDETGFDVSEAEMDYFTAVQRQVERRRRIDANTSNTVRRIERLVSRGEIAAIAEESKPAVEAIVRRFSVSQEDLMNRYLRQPTGSLESLGHQERRDLHRQELEKVLVTIRQDLAGIVGEADAAKISDSTLASPWGVRNNPRLAGRDNR
jgi:polyhydroxyalkanoate synthesis regulator phasin